MNYVEIQLNGNRLGAVPFHLALQAQEIMQKYIGMPECASVCEQAVAELKHLIEIDGSYCGEPMQEMCFMGESVDILPVPKRVLYRGDRTIVFWDDGDKTIVKLGDGETFDEYAGFCAAFTKKMFGSAHRAKKFLDTVKVHQKPKKTKEVEYEPEQQVIDPDWEGK